MKYFFFLYLLFPLISNANFFNKVREYRYSLFETEEKCREHQENHDTWFNCFQIVRFMPDGTATMLLTDIMNMATYKLDLEKNSIFLKSLGSGDMPKSIKFNISPNKRAIIETINFKVWELYNAESNPNSPEQNNL